MSDFGGELARLMTERGIGVRQLARAVYCNPGHVSNLRSGKARPSRELAAALDKHLSAGGALVALVPAAGSAIATAAGDEIAALELARRAAASDVGDSTCERIELVVDDLATAYPRTEPGDLLGRVRAHLGYTTKLLDGRATLAQRRRLLVSGGWLSLLAATCLIDLDEDTPAVAYLRTAEQLARETGHAEMAAWCAETRAWKHAHRGQLPPAAVELSQGAQQVAPKRRQRRTFRRRRRKGGRGRASAIPAQTRAVLARVDAPVSPLHDAGPARASLRIRPAQGRGLRGHHLVVGRRPGRRAGRPRRPRPPRSPAHGCRATAAPARAPLDLVSPSSASGKHDEASADGAASRSSGYLVPSNSRRAREVVAAVTGRGIPGARSWPTPTGQRSKPVRAPGRRMTRAAILEATCANARRPARLGLAGRRSFRHICA